MTSRISFSSYDSALAGWLVAGVVLAASISAIIAIRWIARRRLALAHETEHQWDDLLLDLVTRTKVALLFFPLLALATRAVDLGPREASFVRALAIIGFLVQSGLWAGGLVEYWLDRYRRDRLITDAAAATTVAAFGFLSKLALWSIILLVALDNLGFDITALIAGLGIGGIAVALATQNILSDLFASLSIVIDKPFVLGDFIIVGEQLGTVEHIGMKTTRVRSLWGEQLVFSNSDLLQSRIRNFKRMEERRIAFRFGVVYDTPREKLERIPASIRRIIEQQDRTRFDRAHFQTFGAHSLEFEAVYYVLSPDFNAYMDIQQAINLEILSELDSLGVRLALPVRHIYMHPAAE